jgi:hypothetical protein
LLDNRGRVAIARRKPGVGLIYRRAIAHPFLRNRSDIAWIEIDVERASIPQPRFNRLGMGSLR